MPPTSSRTKSGTRRLSDLAKHLAAPADIASTGWPAVRKTCVEKLGIDFDDWQDGAGRVILSKRADGSLAAMVDGVGMSLPRQVGKTYLIGATVFALCVNMPGLLVIWSAHHARTHGETFLAMQGFAGRSKVKAHVRQVFMGSGDEEIRFHNGSRILFGARERGFGRGIPGVDVLIFDEAQILSDRALANMLATMNTSRFGLALYIGTPPKPDDMSEVFKRMREDALSGDLVDGAWIELGAERGAKPDDRTQWAIANPSYPRRTPAQSMLRLQRKLTPEDYLREGLGIWDDEGGDAAFGSGVWGDGAAERAEMPPVAGVGIATSWDRAWTSIGAAGHAGGDEMWVWSSDRARKTSWAAKRAKDIQRRHGCRVVVAGSGPSAALIPDLEAEGVDVTVASVGEYMDACAAIYDKAQEKHLRHLPPSTQETVGDDHLAAAVAGASRKKSGDRWRWDRQSPGADVSMLEAVTLAAWAARSRREYDLLESIR